MTVTEVAFAVGYNDPAYFSRVFRTETGKSPLQYRKLR
jgi:AraC-like DNA-binding protein